MSAAAMEVESSAQPVVADVPQDAKALFDAQWRANLVDAESGKRKGNGSQLCTHAYIARMKALLEAEALPIDINETRRMEKFEMKREQVNVVDENGLTQTTVVTKLLRRAHTRGNTTSTRHKVFEAREVIAAEDAYVFLMKHHNEATALHVQHIGADSAFKKIERAYYGIEKRMLYFINKHCLTCRKNESVKSGKVVKAIRSHRTFWRWQMDLIDMQRFSAREYESRLEALEGQLAAISQQLTAGGPGAAQLHQVRYTILNSIAEVRDEMRRCIRLGEVTEFRWILTLKDHFSRFVWLRALKSQACPAVTLEMKRIFNEWGCPRILQFDNGGEFNGPELTDLIARLNIRTINGRPYHSQSQGSVEQMNGVVERRLAKILPVDATGRTRFALWPEFLDEIQALCNSNITRVLKTTPYELMLHHPAPMNTSPIDDVALQREEDLVKENGAVMLAAISEPATGAPDPSTVDAATAAAAIDVVDAAAAAVAAGILSSAVAEGATAALLMDPVAALAELNRHRSAVESDDNMSCESAPRPFPLSLPLPHLAVAASAATPRPVRSKRHREPGPAAAAPVETADAESDDVEAFKELQRQQADEAAEQSRKRTQHRYSAHATEYKQGEVALLHVHENFKEKCGNRTIECVIVRQSRHNRYFVGVMYDAILYEVTDTVGADVLSPLSFTPPSLRDLVQSVRAELVLPQPHIAITYMKLSELIGRRSLKCNCGSKSKQTGGPVVCDPHKCRCAKAGQVCSSACHDSRTCNRKQSKE